jgi:Zn-dependent protease
MNSGIRIARVWGIPIGLHPSWFLIFALVTWSLASSIFPGEYPGYPSWFVWLMGLITSLLFFGSVLAHELGHAWVALRNRIPVRSINLFFFGGLAQIGREPRLPGEELRVAIAGPLVSLGLALVFQAFSLADGALPWLSVSTAYLARINFILALFNLIPGFPLDGGRVLRALVWWLTKSYSRATRFASFTGQLIAFGFLGFAVVSVFSGDFLNGLWLGMIGLFLQNAAAGAVQHGQIQERLGSLTVGEVMSRDVAVVPSQVTLDRLVQESAAGQWVHNFLITEEGRLPGLLTWRDIGAVPRQIWYRVTAGQVMKPWQGWNPVTPDTSLLTALQQMEESDQALLPVVQGTTVTGLLSREQVLRYLRMQGQAA